LHRGILNHSLYIRSETNLSDKWDSYSLFAMVSPDSHWTGIGDT